MVPKNFYFIFLQDDLLLGWLFVAYIACSLLRQEGLGDIGLVPDL
jgi:hypothetical protein